MKTSQRHPIFLVMLKNNLLSEEQLFEHENKAHSSGQTLPQYLIKHNLVSAKQLALLLAEHFGVDFLALDNINIDVVPWSLMDETFMRQHGLAPIYVHGNQVAIAVDDPSNQSAFQEIQFHTGFYPIPKVVEADKLTQFIEQFAQIKLRKGPALCMDSRSIMEPVDIEQEASCDEAPIVKFVHGILVDAIKRQASDIHFEPYEDTYRIRYRQDGMLVEVSSLVIYLASKVTARIKIMSNLDIAERRFPQDGRFKLSYPEKGEIDFRVSICPTIHGEKVVIRILNPHRSKIHIDDLGMNLQQQTFFLNALAKPQGLILITGPTGSGKTVSLYSAIHRLNTLEKNILTAEDPVEMNVTGINQVQINPKIGLMFSTLLRSFLRQDPDIIMVGEIRDRETAEIAMNAAQTGHLVLSSLHTNSAVESLIRLNNIGLPSYNIANSLSLIVAQRLARRLCDACKIIRNVALDDLLAMGFCEDSASECRLYQYVGCEHCVNGYRGRIGLFEVMPISTTIQKLISSGRDTQDIALKAKQEGMLTLYQSGLEKIQLGLTTIEEVNRVISH